MLRYAQKGILWMGENMGALMEELTLNPEYLQKPKVEIPKISPYRLLGISSHLCAALQQCIQYFWNLSPKVRILSIAEEPHYFWHMQDFYVAQKGLDQEGKRWAQLRISEGLCQYLFEGALGKSLEEQDFSLANIRSFEIFLLERFSRKLFQTIYPAMLKHPGKKAPAPEDDYLMHVVWSLAGEPEQVNQIVLTAPQSCIKKLFEDLPPLQTWHCNEELFFNASVESRFQLGTTIATLEELQQLEPDDIILFENSQAQQWQLVDPISNQHLTVSVKVPERHQIPDLYQQQGSSTMVNETQIKQNIWDTLEVDVTAAFSAVKIPLKQLKDMEQGLVVEVGDLMDNKVNIEVAGQSIAWGELLVVGDKFGVRIQGLHDAASRMEQSLQAANSALPEEAVANSNLAKEEPPKETTAANELMDLDLDESDFEDLDDEEDWT